MESMSAVGVQPDFCQHRLGMHSLKPLREASIELGTLHSGGSRWVLKEYGSKSSC